MGFSDAIRSWLRVAAGAVALMVVCAPARAAEEPTHSAELDAMIVKEAQRHGVPERLVRRIVMRESRYNPRARNHKYWGLMQISYPTARSMGFKGTPQELLNPLVNLTYAVPYLANAFIAAGKREDAAVRLYARGYYDTARQHGLLGLMRTADSAPAVGFHDDVQVAAAEPQPSFGIFGALLNPFDPAPTPAAVAYAASPVQDASAPGASYQNAPSQAASGEASPAANQTAFAPTAAAKRVASDQGKGSGGDIEMVPGKAGHVEPPKKWMHDGGVTVLARGEQGIDRVADHSGKPSETAEHQSSSRHARKNTQFASLDTPASAQAYAADPGAPSAPSQSAIAEAITPPTASVAAGDPAAAQQPGYAPAPAAMRDASAASADPDVTRAAKKKKVRKVAAKHPAIVAKTQAKPAEPDPSEANTAAADTPEATAEIRP